MLASNRTATDRLLSLWKKYRSNEKIDRGLGIFKELFPYLITLRHWDVKDRLIETGILDAWREEYEVKEGTNSYMDFEIELHPRKNKEVRERNEFSIKQAIENEGGSIGQTFYGENIAFHAIKARLPVDIIERVLQTCNLEEHEIFGDAYPHVFKNQGVKYFRPIGQHIDADIEHEVPSRWKPEKELEPIDRNKTPVLALLDGAPLLRHIVLDDRVEFFDPDRYMSDYEPSKQKHGTAMASLMCHGDLTSIDNKITSLNRRIYARPVMKPDQGGSEKIPSDLFQEDIIERSVREIFEGDNPELSNIRVVNLSIGNIDQYFLIEMSPWAKLLDWLSFKYNVLFIVSAGNYRDSIQLEDDYGQNILLPAEVNRNRRERFIKSIDKNQRNHRLFSPAESINALTVGALQGDASGNLQNSANIDPIEDMTLPTPYSRVGPGYRNAIKPDIFTWGGRLLYGQDPIDANKFDPVFNFDPPGIQTASPGSMPDLLDSISYGAGTSHAAAIVSHGAGHIFEMLEDLRNENQGILSSDLDAILIKALLVHSATQGSSSDVYECLRNSTNKSKLTRYLSRYLGYGAISIERVLECTRTRATAISCGQIEDEQRHRFHFPIPINSSIQDYLKLTITLAWFSPINPYHAGHRRAKLRFESDELKGDNGHKRLEADWQQVRKGTVQHEIFQLNENNLSENALDLYIQCDDDAGTVEDAIPYGFAVTLEVAEKENIDLYQEVKEKIRPPIEVRGS